MLRAYLAAEALISGAGGGAMMRPDNAGAFAAAAAALAAGFFAGAFACTWPQHTLKPMQAHQTAHVPVLHILNLTQPPAEERDVSDSLLQAGSCSM